MGLIILNVRNCDSLTAAWIPHVMYVHSRAVQPNPNRVAGTVKLAVIKTGRDQRLGSVAGRYLRDELLNQGADEILAKLDES